MNKYDWNFVTSQDKDSASFSIWGYFYPLDLVTGKSKKLVVHFHQASSGIARPLVHMLNCHMPTPARALGCNASELSWTTILPLHIWNWHLRPLTSPTEYPSVVACVVEPTTLRDWKKFSVILGHTQKCPQLAHICWTWYFFKGTRLFPRLL